MTLPVRATVALSGRLRPRTRRALARSILHREKELTTPVKQWPMVAITVIFMEKPDV